MEKKLTAQIAAAYFGCMISETKFGANESEWTDSYIPTGMDNDGYFDKDYNDIRFRHCQLILTPITEISEEDLIEVIKRCEWWDCYKRYTEMRIEGMRLKFNGWKVIGGYDTAQECEQSCLNQSQIDYLRSSVRPDGTPKPVYDCGYGSIPSLIEAGIAVKQGDI